MPGNITRSPNFVAVPPMAEGLPANIAELPIWMQAVRHRADIRTAELAAGTTALRHESGVIGLLARLTLPLAPPEPDANLVARAVQDVELALLDPADESGISLWLPAMAARARAHAHATRFRSNSLGKVRLRAATWDVLSNTVPLLRAANAQLREYGLPSDPIEGLARRGAPPALTRAIARAVIGQEPRDLLFHTVLGPDPASQSREQ